MRSTPDRSRSRATPSGLLVPRRIALRSGLAAFAAAFAAKSFGCGDDGATGTGGSGPGAGGGGPTGTGSTGIGGAGGQGGGAASPFPARDVPARPALRSLIAQVGELGEPDAIGLRLPPGFTARVVARTDEAPVAGAPPWHLLPDGGATFATADGGWIYTSNSEMLVGGGASALRFDADGVLVDAYRILEGTSTNCAGGPTPWHTWLSCEETIRGQVFECDPWGEVAAIARPALGVFKHEAATIDPDRAHVYLTEDQEDGRLYRFVPDALTADGHPDLAAGTLEVAVVAEGGAVTWVALPDPQLAGGTPTREQVPGATVFEGGEGIWYHQGVVYLATKGDNRVWAYDVEAARMSILYDRAVAADPEALKGVDNLTVSCCGDVLVAEDGGSMQVVAVLPDGTLRPLVQVTGHGGSEITGPAFDPSGTRLYFSSQRGADGGGGIGVTYEITGPFHEPA